MLIPKLPGDPNLSPVRFLYGIWQNLLGNTSLKLPDLPTNDPNISPTSLLNAIWKATQNGGGGGGLPSQSGHAGEFLTTDGTTPSWVPLTGGGYMLGSNNLSDLTNIATARTNLGGTAAGIAVFTAASAAAARAAIGAGTSSFSGAYADLTGKPTLGTAAALNTGYSSGSVVKLVDSPSNPPNPAIRFDADGGRVFYLAGNNSPGVGSYELTLPVSNGTLVSTGDTGSVTNAMLENSSITINGTPVSLGGSTTISTGLTVNTTTVSGASANDLLISDGTKLQKLTPGTGVSTALANAVDAASGFLTYGIIGTSGTKLGFLNTANTWSAAQTVGVGTNSATPASGLSIANTTAAVSGTQSASPLLLLSGQGWNSGSSASHAVDWSWHVLPVQGNPVTSNLSLRHRINGGSWVNSLVFTSPNDGSGDYATLSSTYGSCTISIGGGGSTRIGGLTSTGSGSFQIDSSGGSPIVIAAESTWVMRLGVDQATTPTAQTIKAHNVTTGTGADLVLSNGKGSVSGGAVKIAVSATNGASVVAVTVKATGVVNIANLPTSASGLSTGDLWNNSGVLNVA